MHARIFASTSWDTAIHRGDNVGLAGARRSACLRAVLARCARPLTTKTLSKSDRLIRYSRGVVIDRPRRLGGDGVRVVRDFGQLVWRLKSRKERLLRRNLEYEALAFAVNET